ncbi:hypothetical protein DL96DRAFT_1498861 [Flagelloscypha sp. PMI_526]|nr:hypothetical protein DL96DRAFT_1498861 [Flagelloscypha sp. PMI_526]
MAASRSQDGFLTPDSDPSHTPRRSMPSFENLVLLANWRENQEKLRSARKNARKILWRDRGEPVVLLNNVEDCIRHALRGGGRAFVLASSIRALFNLCLAALKIGSISKEKRFALVRHALFGEDTWRFGAMLGTFVSVYKFLINALPILVPAINLAEPPTSAISESDDEDEPISMETRPGRSKTLPPVLPSTYLDVTTKTSERSRDGRLSLSATAQLGIIRKQTRRWHSVLAGFLSGALGIAWEKRARRTIIGQQMFVRGLQGQYNAYSTKHNINVPHGDILVFSLACGQIMYAWLMRPDTLPISYSNWICNAGRIPKQSPPLNMALWRGTTPKVALVDELIARNDATPAAFAELRELRNNIMRQLAGEKGITLPPKLPCSALHPWDDSCVRMEIPKFFAVARWMLPVYSALHFIPAILFKRQKFMKDPISILLKAGIGSLRSSAFLGTFVFIFHSVFCAQYQLWLNLSPIVPQWVLDLVLSRFSFYLPGFMTGLALFWEAKHRRGELAMYVLPKAMESAWRIGTGKARGLAGLKKTGDKGVGNILLMAVAMGMTMGIYQNDPEHLSGLVRRILYQFVGPN